MSGTNNNKSNKMVKKPNSDEELDAPPSKEKKSSKVSPPDDERRIAPAAAHFAAAFSDSINQFVVDNEILTILNPSHSVLAALAKVSEDDPAVAIQFFQLQWRMPSREPTQSGLHLQRGCKVQGITRLQWSSSRILFASICAKPVAVLGRVSFWRPTLFSRLSISNSVFAI
jgi:hypothetical protein